MALTAFTLARALNESSMAYVPSNIEPWNFVGNSFSAAICEANCEILRDSGDIAEFVANSNELIAETIMTNPDRVQILTENVITSAWEKLKEWIGKLIAVVKGLIARLRAGFAKMTNNTDKWLRIMKNRVEEAAKRPGMDGFTYEMYEYNYDYIRTTLPGSMSNLETQWRKDSGLETIKEMSEISGEMQKYANARNADINKHKNTPYNSDVNHSTGSGTAKIDVTNAQVLDPEINKLNDKASTEKTLLDNFKKEFHKRVASVIGVKEAISSIDAVEAAIEKTARGAEKKTLQIHGKTGDMLDKISGSKDAISKIEETYKEKLKFLETAKTTIDGISKELESNLKGGDTVDGKLLQAANGAYTARLTRIREVTAAYNTEMNQITQINTRLVTEMAKDYMGALTKYAAYKGTKD